jgi:DNA (cytosine-5)-methyltransferase 1
VERLPADLRDAALWWNPPPPPRRNAAFADIVEDAPDSVPWHAPEETARLLAMMTPANRAKVEAATRAGRRMVGGLYRRTRPDGQGGRIQRAEVRFDDVAGCLRTPAGGSSRQTLLIVEGARIRSRLISARETARLMGLPEEYFLPQRYNDAYHLTGDGVVVDVVAHLRRHLFEPALGLSAHAAPAAAI